MPDELLTTNEATRLIGVTRATMCQWRKHGGGPAFETYPTQSEISIRSRYAYRLDAVLAFLASRGATKTELKAAKRKAVTTRKLKLAREADKARIKAVTYVRIARAARMAAAEAGHKPSAAILLDRDF